MVTQAAVNGRRVFAGLPETSEPKALSHLGNQLALWLVIAAVLYNAVLAVLAARGVPMGYSTVAGVETLILLTCLVLCLSVGISIRDITPIGLVWFVTVLAVIVSIKFEMLYVSSIRNFAIISFFCMLGQRMDEEFVKKAFMIVSLITLVVLVWEISLLESYAAFFSPAHYLNVTRGMPLSEYDNSGLSVGTIAFEGRFNLGIFSGRRTSSIFLEQVGINSYAIVCMVFLNGFWNKISKKEKLLQIFTIILIVVSNNARMAAFMCIIMPIGYFVYPKLNRSIIFFIPISIISLIFFISPVLQNSVGDDITGRLGVTYRVLNILNVSDLFLGNPYLMGKTFDSGYGFVLTSVGLFGGIAYLLFLVIYPRFDSLEQRRGAWSAAIYILVWLTVAGTGSFSIKTAALMWILIGCLSYRPASLMLAVRASHVDVR